MGMSPAQLTELYQTIKQDEALIPIPAPYVTINVGTFDAGTGTWTGLTTRVMTDPEPVEHEPGQRPTNPAPQYEGSEYISVTIDAQWRRTTTIIPAPTVQIAPVLLQFNMANASTAWSVTANGNTQSASAGQNTLTVNVWDLTTINWILQVGGRTHSDGLRIQRQAGIPAFGAFTIPVLPVAIVYAPPADSQKKSTASYGTSNTVGTTISFDFSTDSSQTTEPAFTDGAAFRAFLSLVSTALGAVGGAMSGQSGAPYTSASKDVSGFASLLPSETITEQQGTVEDSGSSMTVTYTSSSALGTSAVGGGPGVGDTIIFYKDVLVAWAYTGGSWQLFPFAATFAALTTAVLQNQLAQAGISSQDQQVLLSLDPFVAGGPSATPPGNRYTIPTGVPDSIEYGGGATFVNTYTVTRDNKNTTTTKTYTTDTTTWDPGTLLQMFGFGTQKTQTTTTLTNAVGSDVSNTVTLNVDLVSGPTDVFTIAIWYDNLFGTWAFQQLAPAAQPMVSGQGAQPGEVVTLQAGGKVHVSVADSKGNFAFRAPNIAPGSAQLLLQGKAPSTIEIEPHLSVAAGAVLQTALRSAGSA